MRRFLKTIFDVGTKRLFLRFIYEIRTIVENNLPKKIVFSFLGFKEFYKFKWKGLDLNKGELNLNYKTNNFYPFEIIFLNKKLKISTPYIWENIPYSRLFSFNLHYFNWARKWLDVALENKKFNSEKATNLLRLIDSWIYQNDINSLDGYHSYTISLRLRNWILLFIFFPEFINNERIKSLKFQTFWLSTHLEYHHGGNHLLENLITICICSILWKGKQSEKIFKNNLKRLSKELNTQILKDGGHEERSASYHMQLLDHLVELFCFLKIYDYQIPIWLIIKIYSMTLWLENIKMGNGDFPRFNDSASDDCLDLKRLIAYSKSALLNKNLRGNDSRSYLIKYSNQNNSYKPDKSLLKNFFKKSIKKEIHILKKTGWIFLRDGNLEIVFKCGIPCPKYLGAHAHSDLLSFELYDNKIPIISEVGTSSYKKGRIRNYERSSEAHNSLQLGYKNKGKENWIEPVDVWSVFRVGDKANPKKISFGKYKKWKFIRGSHDGYKRIKANHTRYIFTKKNEKNQLILLFDILETKYDNNIFRSWLHFSKESFEKKINIRYIFSNQSLILKKKDSYISYSFGERIKTKVNFLEGKCFRGKNILISIISSQNIPLIKYDLNINNGFIEIGNSSNKLKWQIINHEIVFY